jgi:hypothetical protein
MWNTQAHGSGRLRAASPLGKSRFEVTSYLLQPIGSAPSSCRRTGRGVRAYRQSRGVQKSDRALTCGCPATQTARGSISLSMRSARR